MQWVVHAGIDSIKFSINAGTVQTYKHIHGHDDFDKVLKNLKICHKLKMELNPNLRTIISFIKITLNEHEEEDFRLLVEPYVTDFWCYPLRSSFLIVMIV